MLSLGRLHVVVHPGGRSADVRARLGLGRENYDLGPVGAMNPHLVPTRSTHGYGCSSHTHVALSPR